MIKDNWEKTEWKVGLMDIKKLKLEFKKIKTNK